MDNVGQIYLMSQDPLGGLLQNFLVCQGTYVEKSDIMHGMLCKYIYGIYDIYVCHV